MSSSFSSCSSGACVRRRFWLWHPDAPEWYPQDREGPSTAAAEGAVATAMDGAGRRAHGADDGWLILCAGILSWCSFGIGSVQSVACVEVTMAIAPETAPVPVEVCVVTVPHSEAHH